MPCRNLIICFCLVLCFLLPAAAEQLWVRNQLFTGAVQGSGPEMMVELGPFAQATDLKFEDKGDSIMVGGFPIPVELVGSKRMVPLRDVVDAAGLRLNRNLALGTVDVRTADSGMGSSGSWEDLPSADNEKSSSSKTVLEGPLFKVVIPGHFMVLTDPQFLKEGDKDHVLARDLNGGDAQAQGLKAAFAVTTKEGLGKCGMAVSYVTNLSSQIGQDDEKPMLQYTFLKIRNADAKVTQEPMVVNLAGKRYMKMAYQQTADSGEPTEEELYLHLDPKKRVAFIFTLSSTKKLFQRVAPQLRLILKSFRPKN